MRSTIQQLAHSVIFVEGHGTWREEAAALA
jgi:hypothetical protein